MGENNETVRRVIRDKRTGRYLTDSGQWTTELAEAQQLPNVLAAVRLSRTLSLREAELVLKFEGDRYDVRLDL